MNESTYFFYDLETSGLNPRRDRIMQFAGQRTSMDLKPIGDPINLLVTLTDDTLPSPQAILITGTSPQKTVAEGISEVELARLLQREVFTPGTIAVGFNSVGFDDEFIRYLFWRTFWDAYSWHWAEGRSRWDILNLVRMTRALRPDGILWPVDEDGLGTNKLELLAELNKIEHDQAHDALSDVYATISVARLIQERQPKLFEYSLKMRDKRQVSDLIQRHDPQPFVHVSGRYGPARQWATVGLAIADGSNQNEVIVYDTSVSPLSFVDLEPSQVHAALFDYEYPGDRLPFARMKVNACPAVAPITVLEGVDENGQSGWQRLGLDQKQLEQNVADLKSVPHLVDLVQEAYASRAEYQMDADPDEQLYAGFVNDKDRRLMDSVNRRDSAGLVDWHPSFDDERLPRLLLHYKARYYPESLAYDEQLKWGEYRRERLLSQVAPFKIAMAEIAQMDLSERDQELLVEVEDWAHQVLPSGALE